MYYVLFHLCDLGRVYVEDVNALGEIHFTTDLRKALLFNDDEVDSVYMSLNHWRRDQRYIAIMPYDKCK